MFVVPKDVQFESDVRAMEPPCPSLSASLVEEPPFDKAGAPCTARRPAMLSRLAKALLKALSELDHPLQPSGGRWPRAAGRVQVWRQGQRQ